MVSIGSESLIGFAEVLFAGAWVTAEFTRGTFVVLTAALRSEVFLFLLPEVPDVA